ncbi:related to monocarboxylate transporter 4 [Fusarium proliferatum]|nr:related to monocarboxylate transporter 4 [Fusarium proliferatum]
MPFESREKENKDGDAPPQRRLSVLGRVLSRTSAIDSDPGPPPDGEFWAWASAIAGHIVTLNSWGYKSSFGVFQTHYTANLHNSASQISWIGSFQTSALFFIGTLSGRLTDAGYFRITFAAGTLLTCLGVFMTSLTLLLFRPTLSGALAFGITATGSATGGPMFPSMARQLLGSIGFAWTATFFPFYYLASFAVSQLGKPLKCSAALNILLVVNSVGIIDRSLPNAIAHHFGSIAVLIPVVFISSTCLFTCSAVSTEAGSYAWASVYGGIVAGASMSLFPPALPDLTTGVHKTGVRMGMIFTTNSIATLTGPPIAGMIIRRSGGHYLSAQIFAGASLPLGGVSIFMAKRFRRVGGQYRAT